MLSRLLQVKARRERRLRARLAQMAREAERLAAHSVAIARERLARQTAYRALLAESGVLDQRALARLRGHVAAARQAERALAAEAQAVAAARAALSAEQAALAEQLRQLLRQQEKLTLMMETR